MNIVQRADFFLQHFRDVVERNNNPEDVMKDAMLFSVLLPQADYYEIPKDILSFADSMVPRRGDGLIYPEDLKLDVDARAPSETCALTLAGWEDALFLVHRKKDAVEQYHIFCAMHLERDGERGVQVSCMGGFTIEPRNEQGDYLFLGSDYRDAPKINQSGAIMLLLHIAHCFMIINQPRFVIQSPAATRQQRKYMMKARKIPTGAWKKIEWNIAEPVYAHNESKQGGWNMPLHYKRGHWRKAEAHWDDVVIRKDGKPYKWIEGYWAGHPAYGVQRSYHAPKLGKNHEAIYA